MNTWTAPTAPFDGRIRIRRSSRVRSEGGYPMECSRCLAFALSTLCFVAGDAFAQTPARFARIPRGNGAGGGAGTVGNILCDDPCNNAQYGFASQCFADFPSFSSATYDD